MDITYRTMKVLEYYRRGAKQPFILQYGVLRKGVLGGFITMAVYYGANVGMHRMVMPAVSQLLIKMVLLVVLGYLEGLCEWQYMDAIRKSSEPSQDRAVKLNYKLFSGVIGLGMFLAVILTDLSVKNPVQTLAYFAGFSMMGWLYANFTWSTGVHLLVDNIKEGISDPSAIYKKLSK